MKIIIMTLMLISAVLMTHAEENSLIPDSVNRILAEIKPNMPESQLEKIMQKYYPETKIIPSNWVGHPTGYIEFKINERYKVSVLAYKDSQNPESRFVRTDTGMTVAVIDLEQKKQIRISIYEWDR